MYRYWAPVMSSTGQGAKRPAEALSPDELTERCKELEEQCKKFEAQCKRRKKHRLPCLSLSKDIIKMVFETLNSIRYCKADAHKHLVYHTRVYNQDLTTRYQQSLQPRSFEFEETTGVWKSIVDPAATGCLSDVFNGKVDKVTYKTQWNTYEACMDPSTRQYVQTNTSHPAHTKRRLREHPQPPPPTLKAMPPPYEIDVLTGAPLPFQTVEWAKRMLNSHSFSPKYNKTVVGSPLIAKLATLFSSLSLKFEYDDSKCELWVRPAVMMSWLTRASTPGYGGVRVVMHGSSHYDAIRKNPLCFEMNKSKTTQNLKGPGIYVGLTDYIPSTYNKGLPRGSAILALCLMPNQVAGGHSEQYTMGRLKGHSVPDAMVVRDVPCLLPLGLAVAKAAVGSSSSS